MSSSTRVCLFYLKAHGIARESQMFNVHRGKRILYEFVPSAQVLKLSAER